MNKSVSSTCTVVVPVYRELCSAELQVLKHNLDMLARNRVVLIGSRCQRDLLRKTRDVISPAVGQEIFLELFEGNHFESVKGYNSLLKSETFFRRFLDSEYILICQHDAVVLRDEVEEWVQKGYAFVGAPMFKGYSEPHRPLKLLKTLNGGFSLRHVQSALRVLQSTKIINRTRFFGTLSKLGFVRIADWICRIFLKSRVMVVKSGINEDIFWSGFVPERFPDFRVPRPKDAAQFAFEACPSELYELLDRKLPMGGHAYERYEPDFWVKHVPAELKAAIGYLGKIK